MPSDSEAINGFEPAGLAPPMVAESMEPATSAEGMQARTSDVALPPDSSGTEPAAETESGPEFDSYFSNLKWFGLHHYSENGGRNVGMGIPLTGTSWLNRPYYFGGDIGPIWLLRQVKYDVSSDTDLYGGVFGGWDWDYYWGSELGVHRATPELINANAPDANRGDRLMEWTACLMYYPWGDSVFRPYWRCGIGATQIDYPTDGGHRRDEDLWTFPIGVGLKYPIRHWLA
ncbi:MAG TPA: hypothetical protein VFW73_09020, partial [Lacipirellulaceae bacterium]|nr:hypothetical protein [Lacipirellulaceae bacterium]